MNSQDTNSQDILLNVYNVVTRELNKPLHPKVPNDIILNGFMDKELYVSAKLKILQMRIGNLWEKIASECFGWIKVKGIDLVCPDRRIALELKNSDNTDNSSSRNRNIQKLLQFREVNPLYRLYYVCINNRCSKQQCVVDENEIIFVSGDYALMLLFGQHYQAIVSIIRYVISQL